MGMFENGIGVTTFFPPNFFDITSPTSEMNAFELDGTKLPNHILCSLNKLPSPSQQRKKNYLKIRSVFFPFSHNPNLGVIKLFHFFSTTFMEHKTGEQSVSFCNNFQCILVCK